MQAIIMMYENLGVNFKINDLVYLKLFLRDIIKMNNPLIIEEELKLEN